MGASIDPYGVDYAFTDDLKITATGDFDVQSGLTNLKEALLRRLLTVKGSLLHRPGYGCGLIAFQNAPLTVSVKRQIARNIGQQFPLDPRVQSVKSVGITTDDAAPGKLVVSVSVIAIGVGTQTLTFTPFNGLQV